MLDAQDAIELVPELVPGGDLESWLTERRPLDQMLRIWQDIARGVQAAHADGLIHRNLKPAKILLDQSGPSPRAKVNDFSLVKISEDEDGRKLTQMGISFDTPRPNSSATSPASTSSPWAPSSTR